MLAGDTSPSSILSICELAESHDPQECLYKINHLTSKLLEKERQLEKSEENKDGSWPTGNRPQP
jgi:hypothetical protein